MTADRLSAPGPADNLRLTALPLPPERDGWVHIRIEAFGLNRSELKLRLGLKAHDDMEHDRATGKLVVRVRQ
jgi:NADPH2:quinone reductase